MSSCGCIYVDSSDSVASFVTERVQTARKEHKCFECGRKILPGEKYETASGVWDDRWDTYKTCEDCLSVRAEFFCDGFFYGDIWSNVAEHVCDLGGHIDSSCLTRLSKRARDEMCDLIENYWEEDDD